MKIYLILFIFTSLVIHFINDKNVQYDNLKVVTNSDSLKIHSSVNKDRAILFNEFLEPTLLKKGTNSFYSPVSYFNIRAINLLVRLCK